MVVLIALFIIISYDISNAQLDNKTKKTIASTTDTEDQNQTNPASRGIKIGGNPYAIAVNPQNNTIYVVDKYYKKISFLDEDSDKITRTVIIPSSKTPALSKYNVTDFSSAIAFDPSNNLLYVTNSGSDVVSVINSEGYPILNHTIDGSPRAVEVGAKNSSKIFVLTNNDIKYSLDNKIYLINGFYNRIDRESPIAKGEGLTAMAADPNNVVDNTVYLAGQATNIVYVKNFTGIIEDYKVQNITLNRTPFDDYRDIAVDPITHKTYIANGAGQTIFVTNSTKGIATLTLDGEPRSVAVAVNQNKNTTKVYVGVLPNLVFVINGSSNKPYLLNKNITVGGEPRDIEVNPKTNIIYVANYNSGTISVINGSSDKLMAGLTFKVTPENSGNIICNDQRISKSYTRYDIGTLLICKADANAGFQFSSWSSDFDLSRPVGILSVFDFVYYSLVGNRYANSSSMMYNGYDHNTNDIPSTKFVVSKYGTLSANFVNLTTIPPEFWTPFYALIPAFIGSTFIPSLHNAIKQKRTQNRTIKEYIDKIGKTDKSKIEEEITNLHTKGEISKSGYNRLKDEISKHYKDKGSAMPHGVQ